MEIKPIETIYNGYRFRSRLEARWAVFFDALGIEYEYEPEGFELPSGRRYLPDFRVKCWGTRGHIEEEPFDLYIEVKGKMSKDDFGRIYEFAAYKDKTEAYYCHAYGCTCIVDYSPSSDYDDHLSRWTCPCGHDIGLSSEKAPQYHGCIYEDNKIIPTVFAESGTFIKNPVLIVGSIPKRGESSSFTDDVFFNYTLIDGDWFGAYPAAYKGKFFLWGDDSSYIWNEDEVERAYDKARQARFEHGEHGGAR